MNLLVGTSGYSYKEWKGNFYPEDLSDKEMLQYYHHPVDTPAMRDLKREESDIDKLMRAPDFVTDRDSK